VPGCTGSPRTGLAGDGGGQPRWPRRAGWQVNNKRIRRLWREEGLGVPQRRRKKRLTGIGVAVGAMSPIRPNVIWAMDFQFDTTADGRTLKMWNVIDEFTREALAIDADRSIEADGVVRPHRRSRRAFELSTRAARTLGGSSSVDRRRFRRLGCDRPIQAPAAAAFPERLRIALVAAVTHLAVRSAGRDADLLLSASRARRPSRATVTGVPRTRPSGRSSTTVLPRLSGWSTTTMSTTPSRLTRANSFAAHQES